MSTHLREMWREAATKTSALSLEDWIAGAEFVLERTGMVGRKWHLPKMHTDDPGWNAAHAPVQEFVREVLANEGVTNLSIRVYMSTYQMAGTIAQTDGMNYIQVAKEQVDTLTLLHECAHIINRTSEGEGHDQGFLEVAARLYSRYISAEAGTLFLTNATPPETRTSTRTASLSGVQVESPTPLDYRGKFWGPSKRFYITDPGAPEATAQQATYFRDNEGAGFKATTDPDTVAWLDVFEDGRFVYIAFLAVRGDYRGQGLASRLIAHLYATYPTSRIEWGTLIGEATPAMHRKYQQSHPEQTGGGSGW